MAAGPAVVEADSGVAVLERLVRREGGRSEELRAQFIGACSAGRHVVVADSVNAVIVTCTVRMSGQFERVLFTDRRYGLAICSTGAHPLLMDTAGSSLELFWPSRRGHAFDEFCR